MTYLLLGYLVVVIIPLLAASWRVSLLGLALQGVLLGWVALKSQSELSATTLIVVVDVGVVRGIVAPWVLQRVLVRSNAPRRNDVIPANLFSWVLVAAIVFASFRFATRLSLVEAGNPMHLATVTAALLLGMFVLASQNSMFSQIVGCLRIENAVALFELSASAHLPALLQLSLSVVFLLTVLLFARFLRGQLQSPQPLDAIEQPTL
jgi:hydrogenase-4 membrane subunit HyfE